MPEIDDTGERIWMCVCDEPGLEVGAISKRLGMKKTNILYHLRKLRRQGLLSCSDHGRRRLWHPATPSKDVEILASHREMLANPLNARAMALVLCSPGINRADIARGCGVSLMRIARRLDRMERAGLIKQERVGRNLVHFPHDELLETIARHPTHSDWLVESITRP